MMNKNYILAVAALCAGAALRAQNLNPTVEVTRTYESKDLNINKGTVPMNVPDSLLRFDTDFDYSVFGNPYKGAYEFSPYLMNMKPQREAFPGNKLYVRAGAGYAFRPEADIVFSPILDGAFQMSLYGSMRGFFGDWRSVKAERDGVSTSVYDLKGDKGETFSGRDLLVRAGMDGRYGWDRGEVSFDAGYLGIGSKDPLPILRNPVLDKMYNALDLKVRARALGVEAGGFFYDAGLGLRFGKDAADGKDLGETVFSFAGSFGPVLREDMRALVDLKADMAFYSTLVSARGTNIAATPHLQLKKDRLNLDLGFTVGFLFHDDDQLNALPELYTQKGQVFYPAVHASYQAIEQRLNLYADVTGGARLNTYSSLLEDNHRLVTAMCQDPTTALLDNTVERINLRLGLRGQVLGRLHYDLSGGFASVAGGLVDAMVDVNELATTVPQMLLGTINWKDYNRIYVDLQAAWNSSRVAVDGGVHFNHTNVYQQDYSGVFEPSRLTGDVRAVYNWQERIFAGIWAEGAIARRGDIFSLKSGNHTEARIPGWVDLGLMGEYRYSRKLSFWAQVSNLLDATIQRHPGFAESGISFTAGICFKL